MACCYENCTNTRKKNPKLTFFRFPKENERRYLWMKKCNNSNIQNLSFEELQNRVVCEEHFLPKCFDYSVLTSGKTRRSLFKFAIPQPASVIAACKPASLAKLNSPSISDASSSNTEIGFPTDTAESFQIKNKDLVSPQRLMNITENLCLLVPPISPPPPPCFSAGESDDCGNSDREMKIFIQDREESQSSLASEVTEEDYLGISGCSMTMSTLTTSTITMTTANTATTVASTPTFSNFPSKDYMQMKYKKILPKQEIIDEKFNSTFPSKDVDKQRKDFKEENMVLNLRSLNIKKLEKAPKGKSTSKTTTLLLDNNLLQTLPTIDSYSRLTELSLANNEVDSFIWFGRLTCLRMLNLSRNKITDIEGLWKLWHLTRVDLSHNLIEVVKGQSNDTKCNLEYFDISNNKISLIEDISMASNLKELLLHKNQIKKVSDFKGCLPRSIVKLTLAENSILNLGDISELSNLEQLKEFTIMKNVCLNLLQLVDFQGNPVGPPRTFDYRPFVVAICSNLITLDFTPISKSEKWKAAWLLSQDQFKQISLQNHAALVCYLSDVCPLSVTFEENNEENVIQTIENLSETNLKSTVLNNFLASDCSKRSTPKSEFCKPRKGNFKKNLRSKKTEALSNFKETERDCMKPSPCKHYIELIEERAKNYKLKRSNEALTQENNSLYQRLEILETTLAENDINIQDVFMKIEIDDEDQLREDDF